MNTEVIENHNPEIYNMPTRLFAPVSKRAINAKTYDQLSLRDYKHNTYLARFEEFVPWYVN